MQRAKLYRRTLDARHRRRLDRSGGYCGTAECRSSEKIAAMRSGS